MSPRNVTYQMRIQMHRRLTSLTEPQSGLSLVNEELGIQHKIKCKQYVAV